MPNELANNIILLLSPSVGDFMAKSIIAETCKMVKVDIEALNKKQLIPFADQLEITIRPRLGPEIAKSIKKKVLELSDKQRLPEISVSGEIDKEINTFLERNILPTENDITDYAKYLSMKYGGNTKSVEKDLIERVKAHVMNSIGKKKINEELTVFLTRYPQPTQSDIDDFIYYMRLLKLNFQDDELREQMEKGRLHIKFHGTQEHEKPSELDQFIDFVKISKDKETVGKAMYKQGLSYFIKDESGVSDKSLSELIELIAPRENDIREYLEKLGLDHLAKGK